MIRRLSCIFLRDCRDVVIALCARPAAAQDNYEIQVYGADTVEPGHTMVELHSNFTIDGSKTMIDGVYPTNHAEHETIEITHGFTDWFETGFYIFTSARSGHGLAVGGRSHPAARSRSPESGTGRWASAFRTRSATSGGNFPWTRGRGRFGRSSTRRSGDGIGRSTRRSTGHFTG